MKKYILIMIVLSIATLAYSQQSNYQSKIFINGKPATGQHVIHFTIGHPLNWTSATKTINITNGLFSTVIDFPSNVFDENHSSREMIVVLDNTNIIDTVTIFAPIERDPTVRNYIRDSINWVNIHNKPSTLDTSITNEIQQLTINGDSISISNGNSVRLPSSSSGGDLTVNGKFSVIDTSLHQSISFLGSGYNSCTGIINQTYWQSFQATESGKLRQLTLPVAASCMNYVTVFIYEGLGNSTQYIGFKNCPVTSTLSIQTLDLSSGVNSSPNGYVILKNGKVYTFQITPPIGCAVSVGCNSSNPYTDGISSISTSTDILFALGMDKSAPPNFTIAKNGYVGIGLETPTAQLEVNGRIKDQTGFLMPVGSILPFGGTDVPQGWLLCDGRSLLKTNYPDLFKSIKTSWGTKDSAHFNLPDLRGIFLRGVDDSPTEGSSNTDVESHTRVEFNVGGNKGNNVGTKQFDQFKSHTHKERPGTGKTWLFAHSSGGTWPNERNGNTLTSNTGSAGGAETRPINASVYYIIKY